MILIIKRTNITTILTANPATHLVLDTSPTITTTMEGASTTRAISQRSQQMFKSPSLDMETEKNEDMPELISDDDDGNQPTGGAKKKNFATKKPKVRPPRE